MNKVKILLIVLNLMVLGLCILWSSREGGTEPYVAMSLQLISIITLFSSSSVSINNVKNNSKINFTDSEKSDGQTNISNIDNSQIKIKRK
ncbi:hypothetical protein PJJ26_05610 [Tenacibaculum finnmarkense]|nr:hypothetical protein PJJ26_05610 [Tenacibaculum finnmarkense]